MNKRYNGILIVMLISLLISGCSKDDVVEDIAKVKSVETMVVKTSKIEKTLTYYGFVTYETFTNLSFKSSGVISNIYVKKGDVIHEGDDIASLDRTDYQYQLDAATSGVQAVKASLNKAVEAYEDAQADYESYKQLFESGSIASTNFDKVVLKRDVAKEDVNAAREAYDQAQHNLEALSQSVDDMTLVSRVSGVVIETPFEVNEMITAGYPVVVVRSENAIFKTSIAQKDLKLLSEGQTVKLMIDNQVIEGDILNIASTPDDSTRTYEVEIGMSEEMPLGSVGECSFLIDQIEGIAIPVEIVMSGEDEYVYVIRDGVAMKQVVKMIERIDNMMVVEGLSEGDHVVVSGFTRLNDMDEVNVLNEEAQ
jgi:RND family efflux transporter MFP subunit